MYAPILQDRNSLPLPGAADMAPLLETFGRIYCEHSYLFLPVLSPMSVVLLVLLERGYVLLPSGEQGRVLSLTPPLTIGADALFDACDEIARHLAAAATPDRASA